MIGAGGVFTRRTVMEGLLAASHAELVAVYGVERELEQTVCTQSGVRCARTFDELLRAGIDAVFVASGVADRFDYIVRAAEARKHVLCEESPGGNVEQSRRIMAICREHGVLLGSTFFLRFLPEFQRVLGLVRDDVLGRLMYGRMIFSGSGNAEEGMCVAENSLVAVGSHCIDLLEMFFGETRMLHCFTGESAGPNGSDGCTVVSLCFGNGGMAHIYASLPKAKCISVNVFELYGSQGRVAVETDAGGKVRMTFMRDGKPAGEIIRKPEYRVLPDGMNPYLAEIEEFCCAILEGDTPYNSAELGLRNQYLLDACRRSMREGITVNLPCGEALVAFFGLVCCL